MSEDILSLVHEDEATFDLEIMGRKDGEEVPTGVVWNIRSVSNDASQKVLRSAHHAALGRKSRGLDQTDEETGLIIAMTTVDPSNEMLAHCVTGWEWNGKKLGKYKLTFSYENVLAIVSKERGS